MPPRDHVKPITVAWRVVLLCFYPPMDADDADVGLVGPRDGGGFMAQMVTRNKTI